MNANRPDSSRRPAGTDERARCLHLLPALAALVVAVAFLAGVQLYVEWRLPGLLPFYSAHAVPIKINGNLVPAAAFRAPGELPVYGSSELDLWTNNRADAFFRHRPTGFAVFTVGRGGGSCLSILQKLAAVGDAARGKRIVIVLSPSWFLEPAVAADALDANLGVPQMGEWIFGDTLGPSLKADVARRMREFPDKVKNQKLLDGALQCLARPTTLRQCGFALLAPVGKFQNILTGSLEACAIAWEMIVPHRRWRREGDRDQPPPPCTNGRIDWPRLISEERAVSPPPPDAAPGAHDGEFIAKVEHSREFDDLTLLARVLRELRMDALFLSQPFNGPHWDAAGTTARARRVYYERLETSLRNEGYPLSDFAEYDEDSTFFNDPQHPSARAWIFFDREIDRFYSRRRD